MGTNYYFITKNKRLVKEYFDEYEITDSPYFSYQIHLNKCSWGWRTLFQIHKCFQTFEKLEQFYNEHKESLRIFDEYEREYSWDDYKDTVIGHSNVEPEPLKWEYSVSEFDKNFSRNPKKTLHTVECSPEEAEIWIPFDHLKYDKTYQDAAHKFGVWDSWMSSEDFYQHNDPVYKVDWAKGEFC